MFPTELIAHEQTIVFSQHFRMSQMYSITKRERVPATFPTRHWILSENEEWQISKVLGRLKDSCFHCTEACHPCLPSILRRRLLTGRSLSASRNENTIGGRLTRGRTGQLLQMFETSYAIKFDQHLPASRVSRNMDETALEALFPLCLSKNSGVVWEDKLDSPNSVSPATIGEPPVSVVVEHSKDLSTLNSRTFPPQWTSLCEVVQIENNLTTETLLTTTCGVHASNTMLSKMTKRTKLRENVYSSQQLQPGGMSSSESSKQMGFGNQITQLIGNSLCLPPDDGNMSFDCPEGCVIDNRDHSTSAESTQKLLMNDSYEHGQDEFLLPSQLDSSSDDRDSDDNESVSSRSESYLNLNRLLENREDDVFGLPKPSSSSEEESADASPRLYS